jgi:hypothetical protein
MERYNGAMKVTQGFTSSIKNRSWQNLCGRDARIPNRRGHSLSETSDRGGASAMGLRFTHGHVQLLIRVFVDS